MFFQASRVWTRIPPAVRRWILPGVLVLAVLVPASFIPVVSANVPGMKALSSATRKVLGMKPAPAPKTAALPFTVDTTPGGATVQVNGRTAGKTPMTLKLAPGTYKVTLIRSGYASVTRTITVKKGARASLIVKLAAATPASKPQPASVQTAPAKAAAPAKPAATAQPAPAKPAATLPFKVTSTPSGAAVQVGGKTVGKTPVTLQLAAGTHTLTITRSGYAPVRRTVTVKKGASASLTVKLTASAPAAKPKTAPAQSTKPATTPSAVRPLNLMAQAPAISLKDTAGRTRTLSALRGRRVVVLFVWGLDAKARALIEELDRHVRAAGDDYPALVVFGAGDPAAIRTYAQNARLRVPLLVGGEATARSFGVAKGTTVAYVVGETGSITQRQVSSILLAPLFPPPKGREGRFDLPRPTPA
jgi:peroxiredoxin